GCSIDVVSDMRRSVQVAGSMRRDAPQQPPYSGRERGRLWQARLRPAAMLAVMLGLCPVLGACSLSYQLGSVFDRKDDDQPRQTGSITPASAPAPADVEHAAFPAVDLAYAKAAASEVLSRGGKDASVPWENPRTGARGTVTPIAAAYSQAGLTCRDF